MDINEGTVQGATDMAFPKEVPFFAIASSAGVVLVLFPK